MTFLAYRIHENNGAFTGQWLPLDEPELGDGQLWIEVHYSSVNYKDMLSADGNKGVTRQYPHTPGIDAAGVVLKSRSAAFQAGDEVIVFGYDLGMNSDGGFAEKLQIPAAWAIKKPDNLSLKASMCWGTAGFTAALSVKKLLQYGLKPENGAILVSGATGGVGSFAIALLSFLGFDVVALTGKADQRAHLQRLGAKQVIERAACLSAGQKVLAKPLYQGAVDTVGGEVLAAILPQIQAGGATSTCGMAAGTALNTTIFPFILRGIALLGVDSVEIPLAEKEAIVQTIADQWALKNLSDLSQEIGRSALPEALNRLKTAQAVGRYVLNLKLS